MAAMVGGTTEETETLTKEELNGTTEAELSALRDNIERKGKNSYYYAHGPKIDGPKWDGKEAPRLLSAVSSEHTPKQRPSRTLTEYAWGDGKRLVTIYLDFENAENIPDESLSVSTTAESVSFQISDHNGTDYKLLIDNLQAEVSGAVIKKKEGQFRINLRKLDESPWYTLKKK